MIWFQEPGEWKPAGEVSELTNILKTGTPPITKPNSNYNNMENTNNQRPPKTWLVESILVTFFCCLPFGIAGIVNASKVESLFYAGNIQGAKRASEEAKKWTLISFWLGFGSILIYFLLVIAGIASGL